MWAGFGPPSASVVPSPKSQSKRAAPVEPVASNREREPGGPSWDVKAAVGGGIGPKVSRSGSPEFQSAVEGRSVGAPFASIDATRIFPDLPM